MLSMPEVEPTNDELLDMVTLRKACDWAELPHREASPGSDVAPPSPRGSLLSLLGAKESMHPRVIGGIQPDEFKDYVKEWKVGGVTPSPVLRSCAGLLGTACRLACGVQKRRSDIVTEADDYKEKQLKELELQTLLAQAQGPGSAAHHPAGSKRIKPATIVDQQNDAEADELSEMDVAAAYQRYRTSQGADPRPEEDLTKDQLAGLSCLYKSGSPPYVDLAVWGPYGRRLQKRLKMTGLIMGANGKLEQQQLYGPPNVDEWVAGWTVFKTGSIMLGHMTPATCDHWSKMVLNYAKMYGPSVWPLIYQSEVRARLEHMAVSGEMLNCFKEQFGTPYGGGKIRLAQLGKVPVVRPAPCTAWLSRLVSDKRAKPTFYGPPSLYYRVDFFTTESVASLQG